jgi:hypothetical protein
MMAVPPFQRLAGGVQDARGVLALAEDTLIPIDAIATAMPY